MLLDRKTGQVLAEVGLRGHGDPHGAVAREHPDRPVGRLRQQRPGGQHARRRDRGPAPADRRASPGDLALRLELAESLRRRAGQAVQDAQEREDYLLASAEAYEAYIKRLAKTEGHQGRGQARPSDCRSPRSRTSSCVYRTLSDFDSVTAGLRACSPTCGRTTPSYFYDMGRMAISAGDTNTALLAFGRYLELAAGLRGGRPGQGVDGGEHPRGSEPMTVRVRRHERDARRLAGLDQPARRGRHLHRAAPQGAPDRAP